MSPTRYSSSSSKGSISSDSPQHILKVEGNVSDSVKERLDENSNGKEHFGESQKVKTVDTKKADKKNVGQKKSRNTYVNNEWLTMTDLNGDQVKSYLRPVNRDRTKAICAADNVTISVRHRGWSAIQDHIKSRIHLSSMKIMKAQGSMAIYSEKHLAHKDAIDLAEMRLVLLSTVHNIAPMHINCIIKTLQKIFPDSEIARGLKLKRTSAEYHLR